MKTFESCQGDQKDRLPVQNRPALSFLYCLTVISIAGALMGFCGFIIVQMAR